MGKELSTIAKGAGFYFAGFAVSKVLAYVYRAMLARGLGPADFGIFSIGLGVMGFVLVFSALGLYQGILHFVAVYDSTGKEKKVRGTILLGLKAQIVSSVLFGIAIFLASDYMAVTFFREPSLGMVLKILAFTVPFSVITSGLMILTQAFKKIEYKVLTRNIFENFAKIGFTALALLLFGFGLFGNVLQGVTIALALSAVSAFVFALYFVQKKVFKIFGAGVKAESNWRELFHYSWPLFAIGFFDVLMYSIDTVMLGSLSMAYDAGLYNVAQPTANLLVVAPIAFGALFLPVITGLYAQNKIKEFKKTFKVVTRWTFSFVFPCLLFTILFARDILSVMFGSIYAEGASALVILALGVFMVSFVGEVRSILESIDRTKLVFVNTIISGIVNVGLNLYLIPFFGASGMAIVGAALATAFAYLLWNLLGLLEVYYLKRIHPYSRAYLQPTLAACIAIAAIYLVKKPLPSIESLAFPLDFILLAVFGIVFLGIYSLLFLALKGIQPDDIDVLKTVERKLGPKGKILSGFIKRFG